MKPLFLWLLAPPCVEAQWAGVITYGQSLGAGTGASPVLTVTQPYSNTRWDQM